MNCAKRAEELLRQAETDLRELLSTAASAGDYSSVVRIAAWAKVVGTMVKDGQTVTPSPANGFTTAAASEKSSRNIRKPKQKHSRGAKLDYPRFFRQGDHLVRIAWSKREKKEYRHKAPQAILRTLVKVMCDLGRDGRIFSTEDFLPILDSDGAEVPSYQAYVGIAFLKSALLLAQHGRQGYSVPRLNEFENAVESLWQKLPSQ